MAKKVTAPAKAAPKAAPPKAPAKKAAGKAIANWSEELARQADAAAKIEDSVGSGGNYMGTRGGILKFKDNEVPGNTINVIVLDHVIEHALYDGRYDPENPSQPVCFAIGLDADEMAPHEESEAPQNDACAGCPHNEFGSSDTGKGKACKNVRRLAMITEDSLEEGVEDAEVAMIKVPVTSVSNWANYVRKVRDTFRRPPLGVITELSLVPDAKSQFKMVFKIVGEVGDDYIQALLDKQKDVKDGLWAPYRKREEDEKPAKRNTKVQSGGAKRPIAKGGKKPAIKR